MFLPYDDFPVVVMMQLEDFGFCPRGEGARFVRETDMTAKGDLPVSTDGGQLSGGQPGGAIGGFVPIVEAVAQLRGDAGARQVADAEIAVATGFGGITYARNARTSTAMVFGLEG